MSDKGIVTAPYFSAFDRNGVHIIGAFSISSLEDKFDDSYAGPPPATVCRDLEPHIPWVRRHDLEAVPDRSSALDRIAKFLKIKGVDG